MYEGFKFTIVLTVIIKSFFCQNWWNFENIDNPNKYPPFTPKPEVRFTHTSVQGLFDQQPNDVIVNIPKAGFGTYVGFSQWVDYDYTWTSWPPLEGRLVNVFLGIPFAAPPVGDLRFKRPIAAYLDSRYIWFAKTYKPACLQKKDFLQKQFSNFTDFSEDCLYLNVFYPNRTWDSQTVKYPVVVHIYGGSFVIGSSHLYPGHALASTGVVVVTFNYRLGPFGFLATGDFASMGNYGLWDQVLVLEWVRDNIHWFRGDSSKITIMGESAGAASVGLHLVSPVSRDRNLYHQAIIMSGSDLSPWAIADPDNVKARLYTNSLAMKVGCFNEDMYRQVLCLRYYNNPDYLLEMAYDFEAPFGAPEQIWSPVVDGTAGFMPRHPRIERSQGRFSKIPVMCGVVHSEASWVVRKVMRNFLNMSITENLTNENVKTIINHFLKITNTFRINETAEELLLRYTWWSNLANETARTEQMINLFSDYYIKSPLYETLLYQAQNNESIYFYEWAYRGLNDTVPKEMGIYHGIDTTFALGFPFMNKSFSEELYNKKIFLPINRTWNYPYDTNMSELAMHLWSNFIQMGNPTPWEFKNVTWVPFKITNQTYLHIFINCSNYKNYRQSHLAFWRSRFELVAEPLAAMDFNRIFPFYQEESATIGLGIGIFIVLIAIIVVIVCLCRRPDPDKFKTKVLIKAGDNFASVFQDSFSERRLLGTKSHI